MDRRWCADRALRRGDNEAAAPCFSFNLDWSAALIGYAVKRNEAVPLPALGPRGILAVHPHAQHVHLEMRPRLDGRPVRVRFDRVGVGTDIAISRVRHPVNELSRFRYGGTGAQAGSQNTDARRKGQGANEQNQRRRACVSIAPGHVFPLAKCQTPISEPEATVQHTARPSLIQKECRAEGIVPSLLRSF